MDASTRFSVGGGGGGVISTLSSIMGPKWYHFFKKSLNRSRLYRTISNKRCIQTKELVVYPIYNFRVCSNERPGRLSANFCTFWVGAY